MRILMMVCAAFGVMAPTAQALAGGTLRVIGNACGADPEPKFKNHKQIHSALGRLTVVDTAGLTLYSEANVVATPAVDAESCLWRFDVRFDDALVTALLAGDLFVQLDLCTKPRRGDRNRDDDDDDDGDHHRHALDITGVSSCDFGDPAVTLVQEPLDTLLADVAGAALALVEASCPEGAALRAIDADGSPRYVCTEALALASDLDAEEQARAAGDAALATSVADLGAAFAGEAAARLSADQGLQAQVNAHTADIAGVRSVNAQQQAQINTSTSDIATQAARVNGLAAFDANLAQACPLGSAIGAVGPNGVPTCVPTGGSRVSSTLPTSTSQCSYNCASTVGFPGCECSCRHGLFRSCSCSCSATATASCGTSSCTAPAVDVGCPFVGGGQGQSTLASCVAPSAGLAPPSFTTCSGAAVTASGPATSCTSSLTQSCSCTCRGNSPGNCSCSCTPSGTVSCTSPTEIAAPAVSARALCLYVE